ncbi:MAG TPA: hypothetical protein VK327_02090 [Candidatus Paceibacterota bacterium]|nr:hypothetical protein [Candidatus Paceibacterota bacterium]
MNADSIQFSPRNAGTLLRGDAGPILGWMRQFDAKQLSLHVAMIILGAGCYGAAMGWWRAPEQALFTAIKFPIIILLTAVGNALLNGMLAPLLGLNIPFRQSFMAILMSFAIASAILGSFSPLVAFVVWNSPSIGSRQLSFETYSLIMLTHVALIAFAGIAANIRLRNLLRELGGAQVANRVLFAWLAGNLFLGSQLSWIFRPFIGSPGLPLQFMRDHPLVGSFYEAVFRAIVHLFTSD